MYEQSHELYIQKVYIDILAVLRQHLNSRLKVEWNCCIIVIVPVGAVDAIDEAVNEEMAKLDKMELERNHVELLEKGEALSDVAAIGEGRKDAGEEPAAREDNGDQESEKGHREEEATGGAMKKTGDRVGNGEAVCVNEQEVRS